MYSTRACGDYPPVVSTPPPSTPTSAALNKSYRWTSSTIHHEKTFNEATSFQYNVTTKADITWRTPTKGDTVRRHVPRGRIRDLAAAFDKIGTMGNEDNYGGARMRRNSEPSYQNLELEHEPQFLDDSILEDKIINENDNGDNFVQWEVEEKRFSNSSSQYTYPDNYRAVSYKNIEAVQSRPETVSLPSTRGSLVAKPDGTVEDGSFEDIRIPNECHSEEDSRDEPATNYRYTSTSTAFITSTPRPNHNKEELSRYFGREASIHASPKLEARASSVSNSSRRDRRLTQAITPADFSSAASLPPPPPHVLRPAEPKPSGSGLVKSIAESFEKGELRLPMRDGFDENSNIVNHEREQNSRPEIIRMGVSALQMKQSTGSFPENKEVNENEPLYTVSSKQLRQTNDRFDSARNRQSLPFSDIPEESTIHDRIDEMFDFVEQHYEGENEKHKDGNASLVRINVSNDRAPKLDVSVGYEAVEVQESANNTYQEIDFKRDTKSSLQEGFDSCDRVDPSPRYTRSPTLVTPHAGQSVTEYRVCESDGLSQAEKVVLNRSSQPAALATSTPIGSLAARPHLGPLADSSFVSSISTSSTAGRHDTRRQICKLIEMIELTRKQVSLAESALIDAQKTKMVMKELSAQRALLVVRERLRLQLDEVKRLQALAVVRHPPPPVARIFKSSMVISNIFVHLNKNFCQRGSYAFVVLLKCRTEVEATGVVTLLAHYQTRLQYIHFGEHLHFSNLPVDFVIGMEVYMMRVPEYKQPEQSCAAVIVSKCRNLLVPNSAQRKNRSNSKNEEFFSPPCDFNFCGRLTLDRDASGERTFLLDDVAYPLEGTVRLVSHCSQLPESIDVVYRGYLTMYQKMNGFDAWERYWAMLNRGVVFLWKFPADEQNDKNPLAQIDLTKCTNQSIDACAPDLCPRENSFSIELLVNTSPMVIEKKRVLLSADSPDVLHSWLNAINDTLSVLRA